jgi:hypothetical protein
MGKPVDGKAGADGRIAINMVNATCLALDYLYKQPDGKTQKFGTLNPYDSVRMGSHVDHARVFQDAQGTTRHEFTVDAEQDEYTVDLAVSDMYRTKHRMEGEASARDTTLRIET